MVVRTVIDIYALEEEELDICISLQELSEQYMLKQQLLILILTCDEYFTIEFPPSWKIRSPITGMCIHFNGTLQSKT